MGYNLVIYPTASTYVTAKAMFQLMEQLKADGTTATSMDKMILFKEFNSLVGLQDYGKFEDEFVFE